MRERIRLQAMGLYSQGGVEAVSIRAVAQRVGVSPTSIYSFFSSRQALIEALWLDPVLTVLAEMVRVAALTPDPVERIDRVLDIYLDLALGQPEIYRGAFLHVRSANAPPLAKRDLADLDFHRLLRDAIAEGQTARRIRPGDPDLMAQTVWAGVHGALALPIHMETWGLAESRRLVAEMRTALKAAMLASSDMTTPRPGDPDACA